MINIKNIYYMLSYAFQILNEQGYKKIETEKFENTADLCAAILIKGVTYQIKRGLGKEYLLQTEPLTTVRGKIDISSSIKSQTIIKKQFVCSFDEFSVNAYMNRIIKTTMELLLHMDIELRRKKELRKLLVFFGEVSSLKINSINWKMNYNRNNQTYQMIIYVCYMTIKGLIQTKSDGTIKVMDFIDEQRMCRLYEKFVLEYYKKEFPKLKVTASQIQWDLDDGESELLPVMQSDIMLSNGRKTLIIDTKYYSHTMQVYHDVHTLHSGNLYQIYTYVKNLDKERTGDVSGMLLYARTDEKIFPGNSYKMGGNKISVETLNLDCDFEDIKKQLNNIVLEHLGEAILPPC